MKQILMLLLSTFIALFMPTPMCLANLQPTYIVDGIIKDKLHSTSEITDIKVIEPYNDAYNKYTDHAYGYSLLFPKHMKVDTSLAKIRTLFYDDTTQIEVYYDDLTASEASTNDYTYYSNRAITLAHGIEKDKIIALNGYKVHLLAWSRPKLSALEADKNHYVSADIIINQNEVYTIMIKSALPITNVDELLTNFSIIPKQGAAKNYKYFYPSKTVMNAETRNFFSTYFNDDAKLCWGIFEPDAPENLTKLRSLEDNLSYSFPFLIRYQSLDENLPLRGLENAYQNGKYVELTLQTTHIQEVNALLATGTRNSTMMYDILSGKYDEYFNTYAQSIKNFGHPVLFRLNNEMNGDWCWYSAYYTAKDTDIYKAVWHHIHDVFDKNGVDNVLWVWNPHDVSRPDFKWNHYLMYYPGDEYVDIIGLTGYNNGTYFPGETWREFDEIYPTLYTEYLDLFNKPFMITEFSSNSVGGNKAAWIHNMFSSIKPLTNIKVAIWWSGIDYDPSDNPGRIYIIDENQEIMDAFRKNL